MPEHLKKNVKPTGDMNGARAANEESLVRVQEISMVVPLRKKFTIDITPTCIQARDPKTNEVVDKTTYRWDSISKSFLSFWSCENGPELTSRQVPHSVFRYQRSRQSSTTMCFSTKTPRSPPTEQRALLILSSSLYLPQHQNQAPCQAATSLLHLPYLTSTRHSSITT